MMTDHNRSIGVISTTSYSGLEPTNYPTDDVKGSDLVRIAEALERIADALEQAKRNT